MKRLCLLFLAGLPILLSPVSFVALAQPQQERPKVLRLEHKQFSPTPVAFSPDSKLLATGGQDGHIKLWDVTSGKLVKDIDAHPKVGVFRLCFFPDGKSLVSASSTVKIWDVADGKEHCVVYQDNKYRWWGVAYLATSPVGRQLAWGNGSNIHLYDAAAGRELRILEAPGHVESVVFSADGKLLGSATSEKVRLWDTATGEKVRDLPARVSTIGFSELVAFSPDKAVLATGEEEGRKPKVRLWEVATGAEKSSFNLPGDETIFCLAFSTNGKHLALGTNQRALLWDIAAQKEIHNWPANATKYIAFSPDGKLLALGGYGGAALVTVDGLEAQKQ